MNRCPACGATYPVEARVCPRDGSKLATRQTMNLARSAPPAPPPAVPADPSGQVLDGRYRIERKVGEGGMSSVYLATDVATGEAYAIKVLAAALSRDQNAMARLRREASLGMRLAHL